MPDASARRSAGVRSGRLGPADRGSPERQQLRLHNPPPARSLNHIDSICTLGHHLRCFISSQAYFPGRGLNSLRTRRGTKPQCTQSAVLSFHSVASVKLINGNKRMKMKLITKMLIATSLTVAMALAAQQQTPSSSDKSTSDKSSSISSSEKSKGGTESQTESTAGSQSSQEITSLQQLS